MSETRGKAMIATYSTDHRDQFKTDAQYREWLAIALRAQATFVPESRPGDIMLEAANAIEGIHAAGVAEGIRQAREAVAARAPVGDGKYDDDFHHGVRFESESALRAIDALRSRGATMTD